MKCFKVEQAKGTATADLTKSQPSGPLLPSLLRKHPVPHHPRRAANLQGPSRLGQPRLGSHPRFHFCGTRTSVNTVIGSLEPAPHLVPWSNNVIIIFSLVVTGEEITQVILSDRVLNELEYSYIMQSDRSYYWEEFRRNWEVISSLHVGGFGERQRKKPCVV